MNIKSLLAGAALVAMAGPAFAVNSIPTPFGPDSLTFANGSDAATFTASGPQNGILAISATNSINPGSGAKFELIDNTSSTTLFSNAFQNVFGTYGSGATGITLIAGDSYTLEVIGYTGGATTAAGFSYSATVTAVPELSTWGMMLAGFGALSFAGYRRRTVAA